MFFRKKSYFLEVSQIYTILYSFYSEFYADSESVTFLLQYFGRYWQPKFGQNSKNVVFWARFAMVTVLFGTNRLVLVKATQGRYWAAMLGSVKIGASMFWSVPLVPARCRYRTGTKSRPVSFTKGRYRAGDTMYISLVPVGADWCRSVPISRRDRRNCCIFKKLWRFI